MEAAVASPQLQPHDPQIEEAVLGALMVSSAAVDAVLASSGLRPEHFHRQRNGRIFAAVGSLADRGDAVDALTVSRELASRELLDECGGRDVVLGLAGSAAAPGNALAYAERVVADARWRVRLSAAQRASAACLIRDEEAFINAEAQLSSSEGAEECEFDSARQAEVLWRMAEGGMRPALPWPFERLTQRAPIEQGTLTVLSGYTNTGKSLLADQLLDGWHRGGKRCALYLNEGTVESRLLRRIARRTNVRTAHVRRGELIGNEHDLLLKEMRRDSWTMVRVHGWHASQVAHHIRRNRWDGCVVDLLNRFPIDGRHAEREIAGIVNVLADAAAQAETAVVLVAQVNRSSAQGHTAFRRPPVTSDLKGSGDIETHADLVAFVYRPRDPDGEMEPDGEVYIDKARDGATAAVPVTFVENRLRFERR